MGSKRISLFIATLILLTFVILFLTHFSKHSESTQVKLATAAAEIAKSTSRSEVVTTARRIHSSSAKHSANNNRG
jgi:hypothetical protein